MHGRGQNSRHRSGPATVLAQLAPGQEATIVGLIPRVDFSVANRLRHLGFRPTSRVEVIRRAPLGDPTIYRVADTELCIRRREARLIHVVPDANR
jgi:ferrous iron transport protein A